MFDINPLSRPSSIIDDLHRQVGRPGPRPCPGARGREAPVRVALVPLLRLWSGVRCDALAPGGCGR